jgi:hypothetical protein
MSEDLRRTNASLHDRIEQVLQIHPELRDWIEAIALSQDLHVEAGAPFLERTRNCRNGREQSSGVALSWSIILMSAPHRPSRSIA